MNHENSIHFKEPNRSPPYFILVIRWRSAEGDSWALDSSIVSDFSGSLCLAFWGTQACQRILANSALEKEHTRVVDLSDRCAFYLSNSEIISTSMSSSLPPSCPLPSPGIYKGVILSSLPKMTMNGSLTRIQRTLAEFASSISSHGWSIMPNDDNFYDLNWDKNAYPVLTVLREHSILESESEERKGKGRKRI